jgi:hypothetical protein
LAELVAAPHCSTCRCSLAWRPYALSTFDFRDCSRCRRTTHEPGRAGWWWRYEAARVAGRRRGRATESLCRECHESSLQRDFETP